MGNFIFRILCHYFSSVKKRQTSIYRSPAIPPLLSHTPINLVTKEFKIKYEASKETCILVLLFAQLCLKPKASVKLSGISMTPIMYSCLC